MSDADCWGIFREREHSPGRENDDTEILRLTGKHIEARGFQVTFTSTRDGAAEALRALAARHIPKAVLQPHVEGDLVKFYGIGAGARSDGAPAWFRWFYHKEQRVVGHPLDPAQLARAVRRAALALGLDVYGGDAIVTRAGGIVLLDVNAWPSFALYREEAAERIAAHVAFRFAGAAQ